MTLSPWPAKPILPFSPFVPCNKIFHMVVIVINFNFRNTYTTAMFGFLTLPFSGTFCRLRAAVRPPNITFFYLRNKSAEKHVHIQKANISWKYSSCCYSKREKTAAVPLWVKRRLFYEPNQMHNYENVCFNQQDWLFCLFYAAICVRLS